MTWTYYCQNCGKVFYIHGITGEHLGKLVDVIWILKHYGYNVKDIPFPWKLIQNRAKCCDSPDITGDLRSDYDI